MAVRPRAAYFSVVRRRIVSLLAASSALYFAASLVPACSAAGDKSSTGGHGGDDASAPGLDAGTFGCGTCIGSIYTPCTSGGGSGTPVTCEDPLVCVVGKGCLACQPGQTSCVGNDIHACNDDGTVGAKTGACDPSKGEICSNGVCKTQCDAAADSPSNVGCEFWAVDLDNLENNIDKDAETPWGIVLTNAGTSAANVTIELNDGPPGGPLATKVWKTLNIQANQLAQVIMPTREVDCTSDPLVGKNNDGTGTCLSSNAFRITSTVPLIVYQFNTYEPAYSNDASLLLPRNGLGTSYRILTYPTAHPVLPTGFPGIDPRIQDHAFVTIVGTQDNTTVTIKAATTPIHLGGPIKADIPIGGMFQQVLGPFDVLNLESRDAPGDLTGTIVTSTAPVAVFEGTEGSVAPVNPPKGMPTAPSSDPSSPDTCCVDHLEEQAFPITAIGKKFVVAHSPVRSSGWVEPDLLRFMGVAEPATVTTNLPAPFDHFTLAVGEMKETWTQGNVTVSSSAPVSVAQILLSSHTLEGSTLGDPSLTIFPSVEQYRTSYLFLQPPKWTKSYVVITTPTGNDVTLDGNPTTSCVTAPGVMLDGVAYESRTCEVATGIHTVKGAKAFGVTAYGYGTAGSYAFTGGADVKPIYVPPPLY